jgi:RND family efflux transporter MFP subunit
VFGCKKEKKADENLTFGARNVFVEEVTQKEFWEYLEFSGILEAVKTVNITPGIPAKIEQIFVKVGDVVKAGDLLVKMDGSSLSQLKTQLDNLQKKFERMQKLQKTGAIDLATFEEIETALKITQTSYDAMLENIEIRAPFDGMITAVNQKENEIFNSMMNSALIRLMNLDEIKAKIQVSDKDITKIAINQKVVLSLDNEQIFGKVSFVSPEADRMSGTFPVEISFQNRDNFLKHNQFARLKVITKFAENALSIPQKAMIDETTIFVVNDGVAELRTVQTGLENEAEIQIASGVNAGEKVIIIGNIGLSNGSKVKIK